MPKESVDQWCLRIAKNGGGRASAYLEEFEGDDDDVDDVDLDEEERAYLQQEAAKKKRLLKEQAEARRALEERKREIDAKALKEQLGRVIELRKLIEDEVYGKNGLIKKMFGTLEKTPIADEYFEIDASSLSPAGFELAKKELKEESKQLDAKYQLARKEEATRSQRDLLALDITAALEARDELKEMARGLDPDLSGLPAYPDPKTLTTDAAIADKRREVAEEMADIRKRRDLLAAKDWAPGELTEFDDPAQHARDNLVAVLQARGDVPPTAAAWVHTLNLHAKTRAAAIEHEELVESLEAFFATRPDAKPVRKLMEDFAEEYGYDPARWDVYKKAWKGTRRAATAGPRNGILPLARLNAMKGGTAGQRYTKDETYKEGDAIYQYHLSVSFSAPGRDGLARITDMHVSFKTAGQDKKFWYTVAAGNLSFRETSGHAVANSAMHNRARGLLRKKANGLNCTVVTP
jgi:hypothetical protein